jgi:hypothetical protein
MMAKRARQFAMKAMKAEPDASVAKVEAMKGMKAKSKSVELISSSGDEKPTENLLKRPAGSEKVFITIHLGETLSRKVN